MRTNVDAELLQFLYAFKVVFDSLLGSALLPAQPSQIEWTALCCNIAVLEHLLCLLHREQHLRSSTCAIGFSTQLCCRRACCAACSHFLLQLSQLLSWMRLFADQCRSCERNASMMDVDVWLGKGACLGLALFLQKTSALCEFA
jgi:hypothetical protein